MAKDTEKIIGTLPIELTQKAFDNLYDIQAKRRAREGKRTNIKVIAREIIENINAKPKP